MVVLVVTAILGRLGIRTHKYGRDSDLEKRTEEHSGGGKKDREGSTRSREESDIVSSAEGGGVGGIRRRE